MSTKKKIKIRSIAAVSKRVFTYVKFAGRKVRVLAPLGEEKTPTREKTLALSLSENRL